MPRHYALLSIALALTGCIASWNALVRYSDEPAPAAESTVAGVYAAVLQYHLGGPTEDVIVLEDATGDSAFFPAWDRRERLVGGHWTDSLKIAVREAITDTAVQSYAPYDELREAALNARPGRRVLPRSGRIQKLDTRPFYFQLRVSRPGFNADSTIAAVQLSIACGPLCGYGGVVLLARRPGYQWRVWKQIDGWVA